MGMGPVIKRTPPPPVPFVVMYRWPWEDDENLRGDPDTPGVVHTMRCPLAQVPWREGFGWRLLISDTQVEMELGPGQYWDAPAKKPQTFYPPQIEND